MTPVEFTKQMKILALSYNKEFDEDTVTIWYEYFKEIKKEILEVSLKQIIMKNKYMPSISEILEECKKQKENTRHEIVEFMNKQGYFKSLDEYDKANKWLNEDIIPNWFVEDMKKYYTNFIEYKNQKLLSEFK